MDTVYECYGCQRQNICNEAHKRIRLSVGFKPIQPGFWAFDKPTSEMAEAYSFGVNLNVDILLVNEPARIRNDRANFEAATMGGAWWDECWDESLREEK